MLYLTRRDKNGDEIDKLSYTYNWQANRSQLVNNRLLRVQDNNTHPNRTPANKGNITGTDVADQSASVNYTYDEIGNLTADAQDNIDITWTVYGKVQSVTKRDGSQRIDYQHDSQGNRTVKTVQSPSQPTKTTYYVRDAEGNVLAVYESTEGTTLQKELYLYGSSRLGVFRPVNRTLGINGIYTRSLALKEYELTDHLGNVRAVVSDFREGSTAENNPIRAAMRSYANYYAFGMEMPDMNWKGSNDYRYGYNGKEQDKDFANNYDYGFRIYNASIAKFLSVDPLTSKFAYYSPYHFAGNSPTSNVDLDGAEPQWFKDLWFIKWVTNPFGGPKTDDQLEEESRRTLTAVSKIAEPVVQKTVHWSKQGADIIIPYELYENLVYGKNIDGSEAEWYDIAINAAGIIPGERIASKLGKFGGKFLVRHGDEVIDVTAKVMKRMHTLFECACFSSGTMVLTEDGTKQIQDVKVGDKVWAYDEQTGKVELKKVTRTYIIHEKEKIYHLFVAGEEIKVTGKHPFYINGQWIEVEHLKVNDKVTLFDGKQIVIDSIVVELGEITVYNFSVDGSNTYYVSKIGILVHNCGGLIARLAHDWIDLTKTLKGNYIINELDEIVGIGKQGVNLNPKKIAESEVDELASAFLGITSEDFKRNVRKNGAGAFEYIQGDLRVRFQLKDGAKWRVNLEKKSATETWENIDLYHKNKERFKLSDSRVDLHVDVIK